MGTYESLIGPGIAFDLLRSDCVVLIVFHCHADEDGGDHPDQSLVFK